MWLGLEKQQQYWTARPKTEGDFCVFAETVGYLRPIMILSETLQVYAGGSEIKRCPASRSCLAIDPSTREAKNETMKV